MLPELGVYLLCALTLVLIYKVFMMIARYRPESVIGGFLLTNSGKLFAAILSLILFFMMAIVYLVYFSRIHC